VAPCSLLTARQVSVVLGLRAHVRGSPDFCTYQGTRNGVFRSVVVTPLRLAAAPLVPFKATTGGPIVQIAGVGYRGEAQNVPPTASGLGQSKAQLVAGGIVVRLFVTNHSDALLGVPQLREAVTLAGEAGRRLARAR
jgi:hypothetical protein